MNKLKYLYFPFLMPHVFCYILFKKKDHIVADLKLFSKAYSNDNKSIVVVRLLTILLFCPEFRNVFYTRVSKISKKNHIGFLMEIILPRYSFLSIGTPGEKIGKGLYIEHGNSTIIHANVIGDNCWINQNVTIGDNGSGIPSIGNNVRICTGAIVLGPITIGDNSIIGANATVVKDVPPNCTVIPSPSFIIKKDGKRVLEKL